MFRSNARNEKGAAIAQDGKPEKRVAVEEKAKNIPPKRDVSLRGNSWSGIKPREREGHTGNLAGIRRARESIRAMRRRRTRGRF